MRNLAYLCGTAADAPAIAELICKAFATYSDWAPPEWRLPDDLDTQFQQALEQWLDEPVAWSRVALDGGRPVGYVSLLPARTAEEPRSFIPGLGHLWHLFLVREWWGTGLATYLLSEATEEARRREYSAIRLWTPRDNARARAFYAREGWAPTGAEQFAEHLGLDVVELRRMLVP
jgi:GNAT superfamily N-acetyltransferase